MRVAQGSSKVLWASQQARSPVVGQQTCDCSALSCASLWQTVSVCCECKHGVGCNRCAGQVSKIAVHVPVEHTTWWCSGRQVCTKMAAGMHVRHAWLALTRALVACWLVQGAVHAYDTRCCCCCLMVHTCTCSTHAQCQQIGAAR